MALALRSTKIGLLFFLAVIFTTAASALPDRRQSLVKDEYDDVPDQPFPGKIEIMPIVQRDTKFKGVSETVQEIIRELPNDEQYERIGKMLNNSYDAVNRELAKGKTAIHEKMVLTETRHEGTNAAMKRFTLIILINVLSVAAILR